MVWGVALRVDLTVPVPLDYLLRPVSAAAITWSTESMNSCEKSIVNLIMLIYAGFTFKRLSTIQSFKLLSRHNGRYYDRLIQILFIT